ncbi:TRAP transporter small permease [Stappia sp.]|uniref:TRAP transporter small permease n=1 Tax=Stappia sp. TaxID=1870903 RepID=UPI003A990BA6
MMVVVVTIEVLMRFFIGQSLQVAEEISSLGLVALIFLSLPATFRSRGFLRIDALYRLFSPRVKTSLTRVFLLLSLPVVGVYVWQLAVLAFDSWRRGTRSDMALGMPNFLPQAVMVAGVALLAVVIVAAIFAPGRSLQHSGEEEDG